MKLNKLYIVLSGVISLSLLQTGCGNDAETDEIAIEKSLMHENVVLSPRNNQGYVVVSVSSKGEGNTKDEALGKALKNALAKIFGTRLDISEREILDVNGSLNTDGETKGEVHLDATVNKVEDINLKLNVSLLKAQIQQYEIKHENKNEDGKYVLIVESKISYYEPSKETKRKRIAVLPLRPQGDSVCESKFIDNFSQRVNDYLVHTNNFAVIDRQYLQEKNSEFFKLENDQNMSPEERAKLGNTLATDYMMVGSVDEYTFTNKTKSEAYTGELRNTLSGNIRISWRLIDVPTGMVIDSSLDSKKISLKNFNANSDSCLIDNFDDMARVAGSRIVDAIYPIPVAGCSGSYLTLARGGEYVKTGERYTVYLLGEEITNTYTGEVIGNDEIPVGKIKILDSNEKIAHGTVEDDVSISDCKQRKYIVRKDKTQVESSKELPKIDNSNLPKKPNF